MFRVLTGLTNEHDWRLIALAGAVCFVASLTAISLFHRTRSARGRARAGWIAGAGAAAGCGIWATHFIAILAYEPGVEVGYQVQLTVLSLLAAIVVTAAGLAVATAAEARFAPLGGAIVGAGVAVMHYTGMAALDVPGHVTWSFDLVLASVALGMILAMAALSIAARSQTMRATLLAALLLTLAIVSHHFIAMAAISIVPDLARIVDAFNLPEVLLAVIVAGVALAVLAAGAIGAVMDRRLSQKNIFLDTALNNMTHGLMMFDADGRVILCNRRYLALYRLRPGLIKPGMTLREVIDVRIASGEFNLDPEIYCAEVVSAMQQGKTTRKLVNMEDGRTIAVVGEPMGDGGWVATHQDITEEKRQEASFRFLFDSNPIPMWVWEHATLRFIAANQAALEKYGYSREQFLTLTLRDTKRNPNWDSINATVRGDESSLREGITSVHATADGTLLDVAIYGRSMVYEGRAASLVAAIDITERKRAEDELRQTREFLNTVVESVPLPILVKNAHDLKYVLVNRAAEEQFGMSRADAIGKTAYDMVSKAEADLNAMRDNELIAANRETFVEAQPTLMPKGVRFMSSRRVPIRDEKGELRYILGVLEDVTERKRAEDELKQTREFLNTVIQSVPSMIVVKDARDLTYLYANRAAEEHFGLTREQIIGKTAHEIFAPKVADVIGERDRQVLAAAGGELTLPPQEIATPAQGKRFITSRRVTIRGDDGEPRYILGIIEDVTDRKRQDDELRRTQAFLDKIVENMPAILAVKDARELRYVLVNKAAEDAFGVPRSEMLGKRAQEVFPAQSADRVVAIDREVLNSGDLKIVDEHPVETPRNGTRLLKTKKIVVRADGGEAEYLLSLSEDVTDRKRAEDKIAHMARHDPLTDLPNRAAFNEKLAATLEHAAASGGVFAVLCVDLDRFKEVNDVFGHATGDALLCDVARRLSEAAGGAFIARLGGDEFTLIAANGAQPSTAEAMAERLLQSVATDIEIGSQQLLIGLSVGVAIYPTDGKDATTLLANADAALYRAKAAGRGTIRFFEAHMDESLRERRALQHEMRSAIENNELALHYQPQARIGGEIIGFEALVRWHHPARGMIQPGTFIPLAEENGLIIAMGEWILREACREAASWPRPLQIGVNLSPIQFRHGDLPSLVHTILLQTGLAPDRLELEVTEGVLIGDFARAVSILRRLKTLGVRIAMDDFGTGYSSLSYLQSFPFDKIKIDRAFITNLGHNQQSAAIVRAVIGLSHGLHLPVMAEGVETSEQLAFLARESCDEVQGFYFGRPAPIASYDEMVGRKSGPKLKIVSA